MRTAVACPDPEDRPAPGVLMAPTSGCSTHSIIFAPHPGVASGSATITAGANMSVTINWPSARRSW